MGVQNAGGAYIADGSKQSPACFGAIQQNTAPNGLAGFTTYGAGVLGGESNCLNMLTGGEGDAGKVVKFDGLHFVLRSLLETLCYPTDLVESTCCPGAGLAVWGVSGTSLCLKQWNPCNEDGRKNAVNPNFLVCEGGNTFPLQLCDLPVMEVGTSYQQVVCTAEGPRILGGTGVSSRQFIPTDVVSGANPVLQSFTAYDQTVGTVVTGNVDLATITGAPIPAGATHVQIGVILTMDSFDDDETARSNFYVPPVESEANLRAISASGSDNGGAPGYGSGSGYFTAPIVAGGFSWLLKKTEAATIWSQTVFLRLEGYWVG